MIYSMALFRDSVPTVKWYTAWHCSETVYPLSNDIQRGTVQRQCTHCQMIYSMALFRDSVPTVKWYTAWHCSETAAAILDFVCSNWPWDQTPLHNTPAEDEESVVREKQKADLIMASTLAANTESRFFTTKTSSLLSWTELPALISSLLLLSKFSTTGRNVQL